MALREKNGSAANVLHIEYMSNDNPNPMTIPGMTWREVQDR